MWRLRHADGSTDAAAEDFLDEELTALRSIHDPAAFAPLYKRYLPEVHALCRRYLDNPADVEDAAAEVFHKVLAKRSGFRGGSFRAWIYTIALNTLRDQAARPSPPLELFDVVSDPAPGPEDLAMRAAEDAEVRAALARLPEEWQLVVELRNQGYRGTEVARVVGRNVDWVRLTHHRALERLARHLGVVRHRGLRHE